MTSLWILCLAFGVFLSVEGNALHKGRQKRSDRCPQDNKEWHLFGDSCYTVRNRRYTYDQAMADCRDKFGAVVSMIGDEQEFNFIQELTLELFVESDVPYWIGADYSSGQWALADGSPMTYSFWAWGQPNTTYGHCVAVGVSGNWKANDCSKQRRYVCEKPAEPRVVEDPIAPPPPTPVPEQVPDFVQRTVVLLEKPTYHGQNVFFRGGIDHNRRTGCTTVAAENSCAIPIEVRDVPEVPDFHKAAYLAWGQGDRFLDWYGAEEGQGDYNGQWAQGTPAIWTTNDPNNLAYHPANEYGPNYWLLDMDMDCSATEGGFFEIKGFLDGEWEINMHNNACEPEGPEPSELVAFTSPNHVAKCGAINVFHWNQGHCTTIL